MDPFVSNLGSNPPFEVFWRTPDLSGSVRFDSESGKAQYLVARFTRQVTFREVIAAYAAPSDVFACWHVGTDTPNVASLLNVVWLDQGLALAWRTQVDVTPVLRPDADQFDVVVFEPSLTGYGTYLYHPDALRALRPWKGMLPYSDYSSKCPLSP